MRFQEFNITEGFDPEVAELQKALKAAGADLGKFGPKGDGIDGMMGPYTRRAAEKFPEISKNFASALAKPNVGGRGKFDPSTVDTSAIQDPDFNNKLKKVAEKLGVSDDDLRRIIKFETAGTFSPKSQDPAGVSIGLIGFTERTAQSLGTSKAELGKMTAVEQLDYVYKFYKSAGLKSGSDLGTMYLITFMPAFAYADDNVVLGKKGGGALMLPNGKSTGISMHKVWEQNPAFTSKYKKDFFTVGDVRKTIYSKT